MGELLSQIEKHIKAIYFFIKDQINQGDVWVEYCPKKKMWLDVLKNPKKESFLVHS